MIHAVIVSTSWHSRIHMEKHELNITKNNELAVVTMAVFLYFFTSNGGRIQQINLPLD